MIFRLILINLLLQSYIKTIIGKVKIEYKCLIRHVETEDCVVIIGVSVYLWRTVYIFDVAIYNNILWVWELNIIIF